MVAVSPTTGEIWVGGSGVGYLKVGRKDYGSASVGAMSTIACIGVDKGFLAVGPRPPGDTGLPEAMYAGYVTPATSTVHLRCDRSTDSDPNQPIGRVWGAPLLSVKSNTICADGARDGHGPYPIVIPSGSNQGWLILATRHSTSTGAPVEVTRSDTGGGEACTPTRSWEQFIPIDRFGSPGSEVNIVRAASAFMPGNIVVNSFPSVSIDPRIGESDPAKVYVIFTGRAETDTSNHDLFVAVSADSGVSFPASSVVRLTDAKLGLPSGSDQWMPAIEVDEFGGINIMFCTTNSPDGTAFVDTLTKVRYVRWPSAAAMASASGLPRFTADLTGEFQGYGNERLLTPSVGHEYHMLKASGCYVHLAYASREGFPDQTWNIHYRRVLVGPCRADMVPNGVIGTEDFEAYLDAYIDGAPEADMDGDELVTTDDADTFFEAYCAGCTVPN